MGYGWIIKHERTGAYGVVHEGPGNVSVTVTSNPAEATMFKTRAAAVELLLQCQRESSTFPDCDVVDYTAPEPMVPDADQTPVPTREQIISAARAAGADRRAAHAAARAAHRSRPTARLIEKPTPTKAN